MASHIKARRIGDVGIGTSDQLIVRSDDLLFVRCLLQANNAMVYVEVYVLVNDGS